MSDIRAFDRFSIRQKFHLVLNEYEISAVDGHGQAGSPLLYVRQRRLKLKEELTFWADADRSTPVFSVKADSAFDPWARYVVRDPNGQEIGSISKEFGRSLARSTYTVANGNVTDVEVAERSAGVAIFRRIVHFIPVVNNIADYLPIPYDFDFRRGGRLIGTHEKLRWKIRDRYILDLSADAEKALDRRVAVALAVLLDAVQAR